jgi:hypothetical protein
MKLDTESKQSIHKWASQSWGVLFFIHRTEKKGSTMTNKEQKLQAQVDYLLDTLDDIEGMAQHLMDEMGYCLSEEAKEFYDNLEAISDDCIHAKDSYDG